MHNNLVSLLVMLMPAALLTQSSEYSELTGHFTITGIEVIDPPPDQENDRLGLFLTGESAKRAYMAMPAKPTNADACEKGLRLKKAGGLICADHGAKSYTCSVAILLATGETEPIGTC